MIQNSGMLKHLAPSVLLVASIALALRSRGASFLPAYDHVIFDEAHHLEDVASGHFGIRVGEARAKHLLRTLVPNPAAGPVRIVCTSPRAGEAELAVFRVDGRRVRTIASGAWSAGPHELVWDGRDDAGREVAPGVYLVRVTVPGARETRRIVRLR